MVQGILGWFIARPIPRPITAASRQLSSNEGLGSLASRGVVTHCRPSGIVGGARPVPGQSQSPYSSVTTRRERGDWQSQLARGVITHCGPSGVVGSALQGVAGRSATGLAAFKPGRLTTRRLILAIGLFEGKTATQL